MDLPVSASAMLLVLMGSMLLSVPIVWSLVLACVTAILVDGDIPFSILAQRAFAGGNTFAMLAIPAFIAAGEIMSRGGMSKRIIDFSQTLAGGVRGSMSIVAILACTVFAALTGSAMATTAAIGGIMYPEMTKRGYPGDYSAAVLSIAGTLGPVIPPSIVFIFYGNATGVSIAKLLLSGVIPGIISCAVLCFVAYVIAQRRKLPREDKRFNLIELLKGFKSAFFALMMPVIILGSIYSGICTPTESAGLAVGYGLFVSVFIYKEIKITEIFPIFEVTAKATANLLILCFCAQAFGWFVAFYNIPTIVTEIVLAIADNPITFILLVDVVIIIAGMFMDVNAITIILAPILHPLALSYGFDPVHFALVVVFLLCLGIATPPFGPCTFIACGFSKQALTKVSIQLLPFIAMQIALGLLFSFVPWFSVWLPHYMK